MTVEIEFEEGQSVTITGWTIEGAYQEADLLFHDRHVNRVTVVTP